MCCIITKVRFVNNNNSVCQIYWYHFIWQKISSLRESFFACLNLKLACGPSVSSEKRRNGVCKTFFFFFLRYANTFATNTKSHSRNNSTSYCNNKGVGGGGWLLEGGGIGGKRTAFCKENSFVFKTEVLFQLVTLILITKAFFQSVG